MKALTLEQVREVLSSTAASRFFEAWAAATERKSRLELEREDLVGQAMTAEARVRLAEETARAAAARAEEERRRALEPGLDANLRPFVRLEAEALAGVQFARARAALAEAQERRRRAALLGEHASLVETELDATRKALDEVRADAGSLDAYVGETCLFFSDAEVAGGVFLVPLARLELDERELGAFVLHRLPPGAPLAAAEAIRDTPSDDVPDLPDTPNDDPLAPPPEKRGRTEDK